MRLRLPSSARRLAAFARAVEGATAVEFALIAFPFFLLLFAIMEIAFVFLVATSLETSMSRSGRTIRTGELQEGNAASASPKTNEQLAADFKQAICNNMGWIEANCLANMDVDVRTFAAFSAVAAQDPVTGSPGAQTFNRGALTFDPGVPRSIVLVRAFYRWRVFTPLLNQGLVELSDGSTLITTTVVHRNEPYDD